MPYTQRDLHLHRMRRLLELLDSPQQHVETIHIAGTKGKGSTTAFLASALAASGRRCGTYTSPHLHWVEERFSLNGVHCDPQQFVRLLERVRPAVEQLDRSNQFPHGPTYFEITTAIAFLFFLEEQVDFGILEVGLGGRLDSTNVCHPRQCVITNISYDHTQQLGNSISSIAREKAGIIKPGIPVVSGALHPDAQSMIAATAAEQGAPLQQLGVDFRYDNFQKPDAARKRPNGTVDFQIWENQRWLTPAAQVPLGLLGEHQAANATLAWAVLQRLPLAKPADGAWLRNGFARASCPARIEQVAERPCTIIDAAHNVASVEALVAVLQDLSVSGTRRLVLATTKGKDVAGMLRILLPAFDQVVCTRYQGNPRGSDEKKLAALTTRISAELATPCRDSISHASTPREAWHAIQRLSKPDDLICITGSFFVAGEMRSYA